jgi:hypothetical protein
MKLKSLSLLSALALLAAMTACQKSSPTRATDLETSAAPVSVTDATTGVTITAPQPITPTVNQTFKNVEQPVTLTVKNAVTTGTSPVTYSFEVATDAAFGSKVYSKEGVAEGTGQTALRIDRLTPDKSYFWRARATTSGSVGPFTAVRGFGIGPEVILQAAVLISPAQDGTASGTPTLVAANVSRTGPAGQVFYRFEVSTDASFSALAFASTVAEQPGSQTSVTIPVAPNTPAGTYFWRVQASDPSNGVTAPFSSTFSFRYQPFDMRNAAIHNSPLGMGSWAEGARITAIDFTPGAMLVDFDRREGPGRWPDVVPPGFAGPLQYTLGMCVNIRSQWHCSAVVQFWYGRELTASAPPSLIGREWFYDPARWGPMAGYQPSEGETVGVFVCQGDCRNNTEGSVSPLRERSNVAMVPFTTGFSSYRY